MFLSDDSIIQLTTFNLGDTASGKSFTFRGDPKLAPGMLYQTIEVCQGLVQGVTVVEINGKNLQVIGEVKGDNIIFGI